MKTPENHAESVSDLTNFLFRKSQQKIFQTTNYQLKAVQTEKNKENKNAQAAALVNYEILRGSRHSYTSWWFTPIFFVLVLKQ